MYNLVSFDMSSHHYNNKSNFTVGIAWWHTVTCLCYSVAIHLDIWLVSSAENKNQKQKQAYMSIQVEHL